MLTIILIGVGFVFAFLIWMLRIEGKETPEQIEQRMENNLRELRKNSNAPLLKFKSPKEAEQFFELVAKDGSIREWDDGHTNQRTKT